MSFVTDSTLLSELTRRTEMFRFQSAFAVECIWVNRQRLCERSRYVRRVCQQDPATYSLTPNQDFSGIFRNIVDYVHKDIIPIGPGARVQWNSPEATEYTDSMLTLYRFAERFQMEDLANRVLDELRSHNYRCRGRLLGRHIREVYGNTRNGSKLRYYCAIATACWLSSAEDTLDGQAGCKEISEFFKVSPQFKHDVDFARFQNWQKVRVDKADCNSDQNFFGPCIFHAHRQGDVCHATGEKARESNILGDFDSEFSDTDGTEVGSDFSGDAESTDYVIQKVAYEEPTSVEVEMGEGSFSEHSEASSGECTAVDGTFDVVNTKQIAESFNPMTEVSLNEEWAGRLQGQYNPVNDFGPVEEEGLHRRSAQLTVDPSKIPPTPQSKPPAGYKWLPCYKWRWRLVRDGPEPRDDNISLEPEIPIDTRGAFYDESYHDVSVYDQEFQGRWDNDAANAVQIPPRAAAPSPPTRIKDESPYQKRLRDVSLDVEDSPGPDTQQQVQIKIEDPEIVESASGMQLQVQLKVEEAEETEIPAPITLTRAQQRKLRAETQPFRCITCKNYLNSDEILRRHLKRHPGHQCLRRGVPYVPKADRRKLHKQRNPFTCPICNCLMPLASAEKHHMRCHNTVAGKPENKVRHQPSSMVDVESLRHVHESRRAFIQLKGEIL